ncbi:leucine-rich repeat domain-containing protein [Aphanizomenon flos-aquae]|uniref:leucine-rich repeat domain-containing protein n=1 Tax=Aphanizomenon flos-aquae TaxID=1176 RepID=UPI000A4A16E5|nr:leucine-rich repeat domain-containing protein [Aphanizomenon flos-aquae]
MKFSQGLGVILGTTTLALVQYQPVSALTPVQVNDIAKPITVIIGGLDGKGSGVIIDKNGNTYTVLTANHVVKKAGYGVYEIITHDGQKYPMENKAQILGKLDLALVRFTSSKNYPLAKIADSRTVKEGATVYKSGFPIPSISNSQQRNYFFLTSQITARGRGENLGYDLFLSGSPRPGMSGGPILNDQGEVIGIYGKAEFGRSESALARDGVQGIPTEKWPGYLIAQTFTEWCQQKANLSQQKRRTVEVLLQVAKTQNCDQANQTLTNLTELNLGRNQISDIKPLSNLTNLTRLNLWENQISDIKPLSNLTNLTWLYLEGNQISDIKPLSNLTNLTSLYLTGNQISDIKPLSNLTKLTDLSLTVNQISDIKPLSNLLSNLTKLTDLSLEGNQISDIKPLSNLTNLTKLSLGGNQISDIKPLSNLTNLTSLFLTGNQISDIKPLSNLTNLTWLSLTGNQISDIKPLSNLLSNLTKLTDLSLTENQISDIKPLSNLTNLTLLDLTGNQISDIKSLSNLTNLTLLKLEENQISDIKPLSNLTNLTWLDLEGNPLVSKQCPLQPESICKF